MVAHERVLLQEKALSIAGPSRRGQIARRFCRHGMGVTGLIVLSLILLGVLILPAVLPSDLEKIDVSSGIIQDFSPFGATAPTGDVHWLGTDREGRDMAARLFSAGRVTLVISLLATLLTMLLGVAIGVLAGLYGGWLDAILMRCADFLLAIPAIPLYIVANRVFETTGLLGVIVDITNDDKLLNTTYIMVLSFTLIGWAGVARQMRISILKLRSLSYVEATRALGAGNRRVVFSHLLPNSASTILTAGALMVADFIVLESTLSYLGKGVGKIAPSWGYMLNNASSTFWTITTLNPFEDTKAYTTILPALLIFLTVLSINFIGDTLRRALDPKST